MQTVDFLRFFACLVPVLLLVPIGSIVRGEWWVKSPATAWVIWGTLCLQMWRPPILTPDPGLSQTGLRGWSHSDLSSPAPRSDSALYFSYRSQRCIGHIPLSFFSISINDMSLWGSFVTRMLLRPQCIVMLGQAGFRSLDPHHGLYSHPCAEDLSQFHLLSQQCSLQKPPLATCPDGQP